MKLTKLIFIVVSFIALTTLKAQTCKDVFVKETEDAKAISGADALYPGDLVENSAYATAKANALKQTKAARNLFYKPNDKVVALLKAVAKNIKTLLGKNEFTSINFSDFINSGEQRQTSPTGTAQETFLLYQNNALISDTKVTTIKALMDAIQGTPKPSEIVGFLGFLGDIGACTQDTFGRKKTNSSKQQIADILISYVDNLKDVAADYYAKYSPDLYYNKDPVDSTKLPSKPAERMSCFGKKDDNKNKAKMDVRAGVMDTGAAADTALSRTSDKIPSVGWPWQTVPKKLPEFCKDEPWAGHFSGSLYELIEMLQIFAFDPNSKGKWDAKHEIDTEKKEICASLASGFLISLGMHSAIEVAVPVKNYLGASIPKIDLEDSTKKAALKAKICATGENSSTDFISNLMIKYTKTSKKRKLK